MELETRAENYAPSYISGGLQNSLTPRFAGGEEERRDLAPHFPTDREAEVQVFQRIEADHIPGAIVGQPGLAEPVRATLKWLSGRLRQVEFQDFGLV